MRIWQLVLIALCWSGAVSAASAVCQLGQPTGLSARIEGRLIAADDSKKPLSNCAVTVARWSDGKIVQAGQSDDAGYFSLLLHQVGRYALTAECPGYPPASYGAASPVGIGRPLVVNTTSELTISIIVSVWPYAEITGTVYEPDGTPAPGVTVFAVPEEEIRKVGAPRPVATARSNRRGHYRLGGLDGTRYVVGARPGPGQLGADSGNSSEFEGAGSLLETAYFHRQRHLISAEPVSVVPGAERAGVDLHLALYKAYSVTGQIVPTQQHSSQLAGLQLFLCSSIPLYECGALVVQGDGRFRSSAVSEGEYEVIGRVVGESDGIVSGGNVYVAYHRFSVSDSHKSLGDIPLVPAPSVSARVVDGDRGELVPEVELQVERLGPYPFKPISLRASKIGYVIFPPLPPGEYRISARGPGQQLRSEWTVIGVTTQNGNLPRLAIDYPRGVPEFAVAVARRMTLLKGRVAGATSDVPVAVVVFPYSPSARELILPRIVLTAADGTYQVDGLVSGDYLVGLLDGAAQCCSTAVLEAIERVGAHKVHLPFGLEVSLDLLWDSPGASGRVGRKLSPMASRREFYPR